MGMCQHCKKGLREITKDGKPVMVCRNPYCHQYGTPVADGAGLDQINEKAHAATQRARERKAKTAMQRKSQTQWQ